MAGLAIGGEVWMAVTPSVVYRDFVLFLFYSVLLVTATSTRLKELKRGRAAFGAGSQRTRPEST